MINIVDKNNTIIETFFTLRDAEFKLCYYLEHGHNFYLQFEEN